MSIALDAALYIRENDVSFTDEFGQIHKLSVTDRGYFFTLMFRVGSNPFTWISQDEFAVENGVTNRAARAGLSRLWKFDLIEIVVDPKDSRKNWYRPAAKLINYHDKGRIKRKKLSTKTATNEKKYRKNTSANILRYRKNTSGSIGRKLPISFASKPSEPIVNKQKNRLSKKPKEKVNKQKSKETVKISEANEMMNLKMLKMNEAKKTLAQDPRNISLAKQRFELDPSISMGEHLKNIIKEIKSAS